MLKQTILSAVDAARVALGDLIVTAELVERGEAIHVPGTVPEYPEIVHTIDIAYVQFITKDRLDTVQSTDKEVISFPKTGVPTPGPNHLIRTIDGVDYRVILNDKVMAGDAVALSQLLLRPFKAAV